MNMGTNYEEVYNEVMDYHNVPIEAVSSRSRKLLNDMLCEHKHIVSPQGYPRDYRGLCDLMEIRAPTQITYEDLMQKLFQAWKNKHHSTPQSNMSTSQSNVCIGMFLSFLEVIDRFDVYDDCIESIQKDCYLYLNAPLGSGSQMVVAGPPAVTVEDVQSLDMGLGLADYDAILLYDDSDTGWANLIYDKLTVCGLRICNRDNSFIINGSFEHEAFTQIINRSVCVIVLISPMCMRNPLLFALIKYAQANNIVNKVKSLAIPMVVSNDMMDLAPLGFMQHQTKLKLDQFRRDQDWFWERLYLSVRNIRQQPPTTMEVPLDSILPPPLRINPPRYSSLGINESTSQANTQDGAACPAQVNAHSAACPAQVNAHSAASDLNSTNEIPLPNCESGSSEIENGADRVRKLSVASGFSRWLGGSQSREDLDGSSSRAAKMVSSVLKKASQMAKLGRKKKNIEPLLS